MEDCEMQKSVKCPYCYKNHIVLEGTENIEVTIVCSECANHYSVNLMSLKTKNKRSVKGNNAADNDTSLSYKLKCPHGCRYYLLYGNKADTIVGVKCVVCGRFFRGNLFSGRTWATKAQKAD